MGLAPQGAGRAGGFDRPFDRRFDRGRLASFGDDRNHSPDLAERRYGQGDRIDRHGIEIREVPFTDLLLAAFFVEFDDLGESRAASELRGFEAWLAEP